MVAENRQSKPFDDTPTSTIMTYLAPETTSTESHCGPAQPPRAGTALSPRELEALELVARGFSYADIARLQWVSVHTVCSRIKSIYAKLAVHSKTQAVYEATALGWLPRERPHAPIAGAARLV